MKIVNWEHALQIAQVHRVSPLAVDTVYVRVKLNMPDAWTVRGTRVGICL